MTKDDYSNTEIMLLIIDRIHSVRDRYILVDRFVHGLTFEKIAELHDMSVRQIKNIVYRGQDKIFKKDSARWDMAADSPKKGTQKCVSFFMRICTKDA